MTTEDQKRKTVALASVFATFSSLSLLSTGTRHLFKLGSQKVFGVQAHTLGYWTLALSIAAMACGIGMLVKLVYDGKQAD